VIESEKIPDSFPNNRPCPCCIDVTSLSDTEHTFACGEDCLIPSRREAQRNAEEERLTPRRERIQQRSALGPFTVEYARYSMRRERSFTTLQQALSWIIRLQDQGNGSVRNLFSGDGNLLLDRQQVTEWYVDNVLPRTLDGITT